jgi:hypothetical protein
MDPQGLCSQHSAEQPILMRGPRVLVTGHGTPHRVLEIAENEGMATSNDPGDPRIAVDPTLVIA